MIDQQQWTPVEMREKLTGLRKLQQGEEIDDLHAAQVDTLIKLFESRLSALKEKAEAWKDLSPARKNAWIAENIMQLKVHIYAAQQREYGFFSEMAVLIDRAGVIYAQVPEYLESWNEAFKAFQQAYNRALPEQRGVLSYLLCSENVEPGTRCEEKAVPLLNVFTWTPYTICRSIYIAFQIA